MFTSLRLKQHADIDLNAEASHDVMSWLAAVS